MATIILTSSYGEMPFLNGTADHSIVRQVVHGNDRIDDQLFAFRDGMAF